MKLKAEELRKQFNDGKIDIDTYLKLRYKVEYNKSKDCKQKN